MFKKLLAGAATLLLALGGVALTTAPASANDHKVDICHYDQSGKWESISVAAASLSGTGHIDPSTNDDHANDIVPPFDDYLGKNYNGTSDNVPGYPAVDPFNGYTGAEILANGCKLPTSAAVTGKGSPETCSESSVVPGSITLTVKIDGVTVTLPTAGLTIKVTGPGYPVATTVTSTLLTGLADGTYTFTVSSDASHKLTTTSPFTVTVGASGPCVVDEDDVAVTATPSPEYCDGGQVGLGSITLTVLVGGDPVTLPASGVIVTVSGPGFSANTPVGSNLLSGLANGIYTFNVSVGTDFVLITPVDFTAEVDDSGNCTLPQVSLAAVPSPEVCNTVAAENTGTVTGGSIALTLTIDDLGVAIPASGVTITILGPGFAAPTAVTSSSITGLADGLYTFHIEVGEGLTVLDADIDATVGDSGPCTVVENADVEVTATPVNETCNTLEGEVVPGSIEVTVKVDGVTIALPATGVTVKVEGPSYLVQTTLTDTSLTGLEDGTYTFTVQVGAGNVLVTTSPFYKEVGDFDIFKCFQLEDHPLVIPDVDYVEPTCSTGGSYTLSNDQTLPSDPIQAVSWTVGGVPKLEGTYPAVAGSSVHIVADANGPDYGFDAGDSVETIVFDHTFTTSRACDLTTLALTGQDPSPFLAMAGFLGLLGVGLVRAGNRSVRRSAS